MNNTKDNTYSNIRKLLTIIFIIIAFTLTGTYAFLNLSALENTTTAQAGCFEVNYSAQEISSDSLMSTTNYLEGAHTQVTLSKNENCEIYTEASIYIHTNSDTTTAPLNTTQALKYKVLYSGTEISTGVITIESDDTLLATVDLTEDERVYDIYIWIDSNLSAGLYNNTTYSGYIYAESVQSSTVRPIPSTLNTYATSIMVPIATSDASIDFIQTSEASNTNGVYIRSGTENDANPIYYYRGNVNNNLIFADTCWKVVRTTETGGLKLIYNGLPSNGQCNNTGEATQIGTKEFNINVASPAYVGYMYSGSYDITPNIVDEQYDGYYYGNNVTYSNGMYTLTEATPLNLGSEWATLKLQGLDNNHYTCFTKSITCENVKYIYNIIDDHGMKQIDYITLSGGKTINTALTDMLGADDDNIENYNITSSTIKGNSTTTGTLDYWYYTNIEQKGYSSYIEDTVWCNDRNISSLSGWDPNGGLYMNFGLTFNGRYNLGSNNLDLVCDRNIDKFTTSESIGNGDLSYPVGLLTLEELMLAGGAGSTNNNSYYLYSGQIYWTLTPASFYSTLYYNNNENNVGRPSMIIVGENGNIVFSDAFEVYGVRPSISLKAGFTLTGEGNGSVTNPYVVE